VDETRKRDSDLGIPLIIKRGAANFADEPAIEVRTRNGDAEDIVVFVGEEVFRAHRNGR
jgi:hypothetical protein